MKIYFITGNKLKFEVASGILKDYGIEVVQKKMDTPEIQSSDGLAICECSAVYASHKLNAPVLKTDVSYHILSLNGFPGPFVKFINKWLSAEDLLRLMNGLKDRRAEIVEYLTYATPDGQTKTFSSTSYGKISDKVYDSNIGSTFDKVLIRQGLSLPQNMLSSDELNELLKKEVRVYHDFGAFARGKL